MRYPALIDGEAGAYGVVFPDIPGVGAMGCTIDEALVHAEEALRDYAIESARDGVVLIAPSALEEVEVPAGSALTSVLLIPPFEERPSVRMNLTLDAEVADAISAEAKRRGLSRKKYLEWLVRCTAQMGG